MELLALFGLLGMGLAFSTGGDGENEEETLEPETSETDDDPVVPVAPTEPESANQFVYDGSPTLIGTDGDDTLVYLDFTPENTTLMTQTEVIDGGLGDDYIEAGFFSNGAGPSTSGIVVNGGHGDDTLSSNGIGSEFNGGDGNDLIDVAVNDTVNGGTGNDTISSIGDAVGDGGTGDDVLTGQRGDTHFGGAGNDVLSGASSMSGGDGNDTISGYYELSGGDGDDLLTSYANPYAAGDGDALGISGDAGNDTLTASADIGYDNTPSVPGSFLGMSGGAGADVFDIQLDMSNPSHLPPSPTVPTQTSTYLNIADFDPAEDVLTVQINRDEEGADREMILAEIVGNEVRMTFASTETDGEHSASIWLGSSVDVSIEDIVFIQN